MRLITMKEAAAMLRCGRGSIYERMAEPTFPRSVKWGKRRLFDADALEAWIAKQFAEQGNRMPAECRQKKKGRRSRSGPEQWGTPARR